MVRQAVYKIARTSVMRASRPRTIISSLFFQRTHGVQIGHVIFGSRHLHIV